MHESTILSILLIAGSAVLGYFFYTNLALLAPAGISPALYSIALYALAALAVLSTVALLLKIFLPDRKKAWFWGMLCSIAMITIASLLAAQIGFSAIPFLPSIIAAASVIGLYIVIDLLESPKIKTVLLLVMCFASAIAIVTLLLLFSSNEKMMTPLATVLLFASCFYGIQYCWNTSQQQSEQTNSEVNRILTNTGSKKPITAEDAKPDANLKTPEPNEMPKTPTDALIKLNTGEKTPTDVLTK